MTDTKTCTVEGCESAPRTKGLCPKHYQRLQRTGSPLGREGREKKPCAQEGCEREARSKGLCHNHYQQSRRDVAPKTPREVKPKLPCIVEDCEKPRHGAEYCQAHYRRVKLYGSPGVSKVGGRKGRTWSDEERARRAAAKQARQTGAAPERKLSEITSWRGAHERAKTHCKWGHEFDDSNTYVNELGQRSCRACRRISRLKSEYGVSREWLDEQLEKQGGACAICRASFEEVGPCVDHDHVTGAVRALLCSTCNTGLGHFHDDPELLRAAIRYLSPSLTVS